MRCLIIGLGNFGRTLAEELTNMGHDVMGVDKSEQCVDEMKDKIEVAYIMDATEKYSLRELPLDTIDCVVVSLGQSMEQSLRIVATLKELSVRNIYARALDATHRSILGVMNVHEIFIPESYAARVFAQRMSDGEKIGLE